MRVIPGQSAIGADVQGVSLACEPGEQTREQIEDALERYGVLVFRNQQLTPAQLVNFSRAFADLELTELTHAQLPGHREIFVVGNTGRELVTFSPAEPDGELEWHTDHIHRTVPARASLLYALEVPASGGDTLFACMYSAFDALSAEQQEKYCTYLVETSARGLEQYLARQGHQEFDPEMSQRNFASVMRPLVREHPRSGRRALYFGNQVSLRIDGWTESDTRGFIQHLTEHACSEAFRYRHRWNVGDAVLWDNRRVLHAGTPYDTQSARRRLYRTTWREPHAVETTINPPR